jgi:starvation-inducible DNA-binding protein
MKTLGMVRRAEDMRIYFLKLRKSPRFKGLPANAGIHDPLCSPRSKIWYYSGYLCGKTISMQPHIGISEKNLKSISKILSLALADEMTLYTKTRKFHWNVAGDSFMEIHLLFESQYKELEEAIDEIAERINKLGSKTIGTMKEFLELARLKESPGKYPDRKDMIKELLADHEQVIVQLRKDVEECTDRLKDAGTADFLTGLMEDHETIAWKLRRYFA